MDEQDDRFLDALFESGEQEIRRNIREMMARPSPDDLYRSRYDRIFKTKMNSPSSGRGH